MTIDPTMHTAAIAALEVAVNKALGLDPSSGDRLATLDGHSFKLRCTNPALDVIILPSLQGMQLYGQYEGPVSTTISGEASDFSRLLAATDPAGELINGNIELIGDSAALIELQKILANLDLDWEAPLVSGLGDVAGHQIAQMMRGLFGWGKQAGRSLNRQMEEFIHEEARLAPSRMEMEDYFSDVGKLGQRVDRIDARLKRLQRRVSGLQNPAESS
ncbi:MAG: ubiquinone biosynthesis protein UbiJ [Halieaceae bacterium]|jgi:ubiquinone biosynthesis protein UbiJ